MLVDLPHQYERRQYGIVIDKVVTNLSAENFIDAIYQVGGIRHPGLSDIDILFVVDDTDSSTADPLEALDGEERYLFTHSCFVVPASLAADLGRNVLLHGYRRLHGTEWRWELSARDHEIIHALEVQTALEFLAKNLLDLHVQLTYRVLKVRVFLQHLKGLRMDIEILGVESGPIAGVLESAMSLIDEWFERGDRERAAAEIAVELLPLMRDVLSEAVERHTLYAPAFGPISFAANMSLKPAEAVEIARRGLRLPRVPGLPERRQFNANHRVNRFEFRLPMTAARPGFYHAERFAFLHQAKTFATLRFPAYAAPIPPLFYRAL